MQQAFPNLGHQVAHSVTRLTVVGHSLPCWFTTRRWLVTIVLVRLDSVHHGIDDLGTWLEVSEDGWITWVERRKKNKNYHQRKTLKRAKHVPIRKQQQESHSPLLPYRSSSFLEVSSPRNASILTFDLPEVKGNPFAPDTILTAFKLVLVAISKARQGG